VSLDKSLDAAVVGLLYIIGKETGRKLSLLAMVMKAFAADALPGARLISAIAILLVLLYLTFRHRDTSFIPRFCLCEA